MIRLYVNIVLLLLVSVIVTSQPLIKIENEAICTIKRLNISGRSNVAPFSLQYEEGGCLPVGIPEDLNVDSIAVQIPVSCIKSSNKIMEHDMHEMLKIEHYPTITIEIPDPQIWELESLKERSIINLCMVIKGVKNCFIIPLTIKENLIDLLTVNGEVKFNLSEYGIIPPEKLFGLIKVKNEVIISFELEFMPKPAKLN